MKGWGKPIRDYSKDMRKRAAMAELRTGSETLEDVFVRVVGADHPAETLDWL